MHPPAKATSGTWLSAYLAAADLQDFTDRCEVWEIEGTNAGLSYLSHGFFRYYGKFPPPVAARFIQQLHDPAAGPVVDPMAGSGTTLVEALLAGREAAGYDINPLAVLIAKVKTTPVKHTALLAALDTYTWFMSSGVSPDLTPYIPADRQLNHWFYPETQEKMARTCYFIDHCLDNRDVQDVFRVALAANVRRFSRASPGMGRMFLDPASQPQDVSRHISKKIMEMAQVVEQLYRYPGRVTISTGDARQPFFVGGQTGLVICHPPYFNLYKYSSIYKYEMLWPGYDYRAVRRQEVREGFKLGRKELVAAYIEDLGKVLENIERVLVPGGRAVLMMGDTVIKGERINTTALTCQHLQSRLPSLQLTRLIIRQPRFTEASYAATQRRARDQVGVKLQDHLLILQKGT